MINSASNDTRLTQYISFNIARRRWWRTLSSSLSYSVFVISFLCNSLKNDGKNKRKHTKRTQNRYSQPWCWWLLLWLNWTNGRQNYLALETHNSSHAQYAKRYVSCPIIVCMHMCSRSGVWYAACNECSTSLTRDEWRAHIQRMSVHLFSFSIEGNATEVVFRLNAAAARINLNIFE